MRGNEKRKRAVDKPVPRPRPDKIVQPPIPKAQKKPKKGPKGGY